MVDRFRLWWLRWKRNRSGREYSKYVAQASGDEQEFRIQEAMSVRDDERDQIINLESLILLEEAEHLGIPVPPLDDKDSWEGGRRPGTHRLGLHAQVLLRQAIRNEKKEKWGVVAFRLKELAVPLIGVLGALWGLHKFIHALPSK